VKRNSLQHKGKEEGSFLSNEERKFYEAREEEKRRGTQHST